MDGERWDFPARNRNHDEVLPRTGAWSIEEVEEASSRFHESVEIGEPSASICRAFFPPAPQPAVFRLTGGPASDPRRLGKIFGRRPGFASCQLEAHPNLTSGSYPKSVRIARKLLLPDTLRLKF
jgi:hypothetical protein